MLGLLKYIREVFHPIHFLRRGRFLSQSVFPRLDVPVFVRIHGNKWPVCLRVMRNISYVVDNRIVEPVLAPLIRAFIKLYCPTVFWDIGIEPWVLQEAVSGWQHGWARCSSRA